MVLVSGAVHAHSLYSDGTGTIPDIVRIADGCGLDFLIMTDHDTLRPLQDIGESFHGRTLLLLGCEVSPPTNHLLAFGAAICPENTSPPQQYIDDLRAQGALTFLAHPHDLGAPIARIPSYRWDEWPVTGFTGLEIWNHLSDWSGHLGRLPGALWRAATPRYSLHGPDPETLRLWDELGRERRIVGVAGLDVHAISIAGRKIFPYGYTFGTLRCHVQVESWPGDPLEAKRNLLEAMAAGRLHFTNEQHGPGKDLRFVGRDSAGDDVPMGAERPASDLREVALSSPIRAQLRVLHDGQVIAQTFGRELVAKVHAQGVYRAEAHVRRAGRRRPFAYTNPVYAR